jgi:phosphate transport system ATP-binding protein
MAKRIDVSDLNVYYSDFKAVEGVTMTVEPRSVTAFIGPSGCGKSTFLRTLNRMHEVTPGGRVEGKVLLDDQDLYADGVDPVAVRRTVGMVFQRPNPFPTMINQDRNQALAPALDRVWSAALTLIIVVMVLSLVGRLIARFGTVKK